MKKTIITFTMLAVIALSVFAQQYDPESDFQVSKRDDGKSVEISKYVGSKKTVNIPPTIQGLPVTGIGKEAFKGKNITCVTIPNSVTSIGLWALSCENLTTINVAASNNTYSSQDGVLYDKAKTALIQYPEGKIGAFTIPNSVTIIVDYSFTFCTGLTSITIPYGVISIGGQAFVGCENLTSINIPDSVTSIGSGAFSYCTSLTSVIIPNSVTSIGQVVFESCTSLTSITIGSGIKIIRGAIFSGCSKLTSVTFLCTIPSSGLINLGPIVNDGGRYYDTFDIGDLRDKYLAGGIGTYTRENGGSTWTKK